MQSVFSNAVLVCVQAGLVLAPSRHWRIASSRLLGAAIPAAALVVGVGLARSGAGFLAGLAAIATPLLAAGAGYARGWRASRITALLVPPLYLLAWLEPGTYAGDAAGVALIAGACLAVTAFVAAIAPVSWLTAGLVLLVVLDIVLVWGDRQVGPAVDALQAASTPALFGRPLPALQQVEFGSMIMGWLDLAAPALLGLLVARRARAAVATGVAAAFWTLLLLVTSPIAATPPVLVGLFVQPRQRQSPQEPCSTTSWSETS